MKNMDYFKFEKKLASKVVNEMQLRNIQLNRQYISNISPDQFTLIEKVVQSDHLQMEFRRVSYDNYIKPKDRELRNQNGVCKYSYISPIDLCKKVLANPFLVDHLLAEAADDSIGIRKESYSSIMDGTVGIRLKGKLKLELYIDDTLLSPGNLNQNQKHIFVYSSFADIPFKHRAQSNQIDMLIMVNRKDLYRLKFANPLFHLFEELRKDLLQLHTTGIQIETQSGLKRTIKVAISTICGDHLSINEILGFRMSFGPDSFACRFCSATGRIKKGDINNTTIQNLGRESNLIEEPTADELSRLEYKQRRFVFEGLPDISRWNSCPCDPMHDLPEGVLNYFLEIFLTSVVRNKEFRSNTMIANIKVITEAFDNFNFYEGSPQVKWNKNQSSIVVLGKAAQVSSKLIK